MTDRKTDTTRAYLSEAMSLLKLLWRHGRLRSSCIPIKAHSSMSDNSQKLPPLSFLLNLQAVPWVSQTIVIAYKALERRLLSFLYFLSLAGFVYFLSLSPPSRKEC